MIRIFLFIAWREMAWVCNNANIFWCAAKRRKFRLIYSRCIIWIYIQKHANICQTTYALHPIVLLSLWEVINTSFPFNILFRSFFCLSTYYFESTFISLLFLSTAKAFILLSCVVFVIQEGSSHWWTMNVNVFYVTSRFIFRPPLNSKNILIFWHWTPSYVHFHSEISTR